MPLKEADLKTFEAYKKAVRADGAKISDNGKTKFWVYKDIELPLEKTPAKKQKIAAFIALVDDNGVRRATALKGKKLVCLGNCNLEQGKVAFDPLKGKVPYNLLKVSVPLFLGKFVHIPATADAEADADEGIEDDGEQVPAQPEAPPPPSPASNLLATWTKLSNEVEAAIAANPARNDVLTRAAAGIPDLVKANAVEDATKKMDALRAMLAAPPPPPPPGPPAPSLTSRWNKLVKDLQAAVAVNPARKDALARAAAGIPELIKTNAKEATARIGALEALLAAPPAPPPPPPANLTARWNQMVQDLRTAAAANPDRKDTLSKAAAGIPDLIKDNKTAEAKQRMDVLQAMLEAGPASASHDAAALITRWNALVKRMQAEVAAHPEKRAEVTRAGAGIPDMIKTGKLELAAKLMDGVERTLSQANSDAEKYRTRYEALEKELLEALKDPLRDAASLRAISAFANEKAEAGDYEAAQKSLDRLEAALANKASGQADAGAPYEGIVEYRKSLLEFEKARNSASEQISALKKALLAKAPKETALADRLAETLNELNKEIGDAVDVAMSVAENAKNPVTDAIRMKLQKYLVELRSNPLIPRVEANPFGVKVDLGKSLTEALRNIQQAMPVKA